MNSTIRKKHPHPRPDTPQLCSTLHRISVKTVESHHETSDIVNLHFHKNKPGDPKITLLHFDSHHDMGCPPLAALKIRENPVEISDGLCLGNWILPHVYAGHFDAVVWMKPEWCQQMSCRHARYHLGPKTCSGPLCVDIPEIYYVGQGSYLPAEDMMYPTQFDYVIEDIHPLHTACHACQNLLHYIRNRPFIVSIDLKIFTSTNDPVQPLLSQPGVPALVKELYSLTPKESQICSLCRANPHESTYREEIVRISTRQRQKMNEYRHWILNFLSGRQPLTTTNSHLAAKFHKLCRLALSEERHQKDTEQWISRRLRMVSCSERKTGVECIHPSLPDAPASCTGRHASFSLGEQDDTGLEESWSLSMDLKTDDNVCLPHLHYEWLDSVTNRSVNKVLPQQPWIERVPDITFAIQSLLSRLGNPCLIIINRSSTDNRLSAEQLKKVEEILYGTLDRVYGRHLLSFNGEERDISRLPMKSPAEMQPVGNGMQTSASEMVPKKDIN